MQSQLKKGIDGKIFKKLFIGIVFKKDSSKNNQENKRLTPCKYWQCNPSPHNEKAESVNGSQLLNKGEKYLREGANIEYAPDQEDADEIIETTLKNKIYDYEQNNTNKKQINNNKNRKGDTGRSSNQGRKTSSRGSTNTNNRRNCFSLQYLLIFEFLVRYRR